MCTFRCKGTQYLRPWGRVASFFGKEGDEPILVRGSTYIETVAASPTLYFRVLRYRTTNSPICLSEEIHKPLRLIACIPLIQRREKYHSYEEKSTFS